MILAVCIDDSNGLMFNNRRLSSDKAVVMDLIKSAEPDVVLIAPYSAPLFKDSENRVRVLEDPLNNEKGFCFAECGDFASIVHNVKKLIVYKWNRRYPSDRKFPLDVFTSCMHLEYAEEFEGSSHPCITKEVYVR